MLFGKIIIKSIYNKKDKLPMKKDEFYRILDEYSYGEEDESFEQMHYEKQLARAINSHVFQGEPFSITLPNPDKHTLLTSKIDLQDPPIPVQPTEQRESLKEITTEVQKISVEGPLENSSFAFTPDCHMRRSQSEDLPKPPKNQYDKNIFANICKTVLREMLGGRYEQQIKEYCLMLGVDYAGFLRCSGKWIDMRMGTSQLNHFLHSQQISLGVRKAFSFFFVRYLRDEYVGYVAHEGRMRDKSKYLRCACKMVYIPQLSRNEYRLLEASLRPPKQ